MTSLNIVFAGTPAFGLPCLEAIYHSHHRLTAVYTQPDRPAGRGRHLQASEVKTWALAHEIPVYQPEHFKSEEAINTLAALQPDIMVVIAYGLILPKKILAIPTLGCVNVHASLLPRWRGASPIQQAVLHGDKTSGVTIMQMDAGMDTGPSLLEIAHELTPRETAGSLHDTLSTIAAKPLIEVLDRLAEGKIQPVPQNQAQVTYAGKISKEDANIAWQDSAEAIDRKIRAFNPWPIAYTHWQGEVIRIHQAEVLAANSKTKQPGTLISIERSGISIATGQGILKIQRLQFPGGKAMAVADWFNAKRPLLEEGMVFE